MELGSLKTFVRVAELGSFSKAAASLGMTQPTISRLIAELERELAGELFYRTGRGVRLTEKGEMLFPRARGLLHTADQISADALAFEETPVGKVCVGAYPSLMQILAPELYSYVRAHAPGIRLRVIEGFSDRIERWIAEGRIDIGLLSRYKAHPSGQDDILFRADLLLVRSSQRPALGDPIDFETLSKLPLVLPSIPNGLRALLDEAARRRKLTLNVVVEADSFVAQREIVRQCGCYSVMAAQAIKEPGSANPLLGSVIAGPEFVRYVTVHTPQRPLSKASRIVLLGIRSAIAKEVAGVLSPADFEDEVADAEKDTDSRCS